MRLLLVLIRQERLFIWTLVLMLFAIVYLTPLFWKTQLVLPSIISSAVNGLSGSPFPLFPFAGFLLAGTCVSWLFLRSVQNGGERKFIGWLMFVGGSLIAISTFLATLSSETYSEYSFWSTSPNYFWIRLGILLLMLSGLWYLEELLAKHGSTVAWMPSWLVMLGVESLFVYIAHLLVLCGWVTNTEFNFRQWWGGRLNIVESILVFLGLTLMMILFSFVWHYLKKRHPKLMIGIFWWIGFCIVWSFFINPY
jgi:hypothetical protein